MRSAQPANYSAVDNITRRGGVGRSAPAPPPPTLSRLRLESFVRNLSRGCRTTCKLVCESFKVLSWNEMKVGQRCSLAVLISRLAGIHEEVWKWVKWFTFIVAVMWWLLSSDFQIPKLFYCLIVMLLRFVYLDSLCLCYLKQNIMHYVNGQSCNKLFYNFTNC